MCGNHRALSGDPGDQDWIEDAAFVIRKGIFSNSSLHSYAKGIMNIAAAWPFVASGQYTENAGSNESSHEDSHQWKHENRGRFQQKTGETMRSTARVRSGNKEPRVRSPADGSRKPEFANGSRAMDESSEPGQLAVSLAKPARGVPPARRALLTV
jgi:hypothetical protein